VKERLGVQVCVVLNDGLGLRLGLLLPLGDLEMVRCKLGVGDTVRVPGDNVMVLVTD